jgi:hypothetical protein
MLTLSAASCRFENASSPLFIRMKEVPHTSERTSSTANCQGLELRSTGFFMQTKTANIKLLFLRRVPVGISIVGIQPADTDRGVTYDAWPSEEMTLFILGLGKVDPGSFPFNFWQKQDSLCIFEKYSIQAPVIVRRFFMDGPARTFHGTGDTSKRIYYRTDGVDSAGSHGHDGYSAQPEQGTPFRFCFGHGSSRCRRDVFPRCRPWG